MHTSYCAVRPRNAPCRLRGTCLKRQDTGLSADLGAALCPPCEVICSCHPGDLQHLVTDALRCRLFCDARQHISTVVVNADRVQAHSKGRQDSPAGALWNTGTAKFRMGIMRVLQEFEIVELSSWRLTHRDRARRACTASEAGNPCFGVMLCSPWQKSSRVCRYAIAESTWCVDIRQLDVL